MTSGRCNNLHVVFLILTAVDCSNLTNPANGSVNHTAGTIFRQTATYSCNTGYNLVGDNIHTCQATGEWSGSAPTCEGMLLHSVTCHTHSLQMRFAELIVHLKNKEKVLKVLTCDMSPANVCSACL